MTENLLRWRYEEERYFVPPGAVVELEDGTHVKGPAFLISGRRFTALPASDILPDVPEVEKER